MNRVLNLTFASSLTDLCEVNSSFDSGIIRIAYHGENRNGSYIDKKTFEKCLKTIYNCPVVCTYDRETDSLGGHDMEIVRDDDGELRLVNLTTPVGCIPESAKTYWETVVEDDGTEHEYLCAEALLWKRQEAYNKIKEDGFAAQSMEISVKDGESVDGIFKIYDFEFTAFALISVTPCFESACLEFSKQDFKQQYSEMMLEIKKLYSKVDTSSEDDIHSQNITEGGEKVLNEKELVANAEIKAEVAEETSEEVFNVEPTETVEEFSYAGAGMSEDSIENFAEAETPSMLNSDIKKELSRIIRNEEIITDKCGYSYSKYWFVDFDSNNNEVYFEDIEDGLLYGCPYSMNNDTITVDFRAKCRKKYAIVDYVGGVEEEPSPILHIYELLCEKASANSELEAKYKAASDAITSMETELCTLREFKNSTEAANAKAERDEVFGRFEDLVGVEAFENLKDNCTEYDIETLEEKCFAIRGRNSSVKFSAKPKSTKLIIPEAEAKTAPYGGLFEKYGVSK